MLCYQLKINELFITFMVGGICIWVKGGSQTRRPMCMWGLAEIWPGSQVPWSLGHRAS